MRWARERAGLDIADLAQKMSVKPGRVNEWEKTGVISVAQVEKLAQKTHAPLGFLYLPEPPDEPLPINDFRTQKDQPLKRPSPELLDTLYTMQLRQDWMRSDLIEQGAEPLDFVKSFSVGDDAKRVAEAMRAALGIEDEWAANVKTRQAALRRLADLAEEAGVLVFGNGIVNNSTNRKLDPGEFQGFAMTDEYAPLIFINKADYEGAQMFTLAHELAHLFVGESGLSLFELQAQPTNEVEQFCNQAAAEFLVPEPLLINYWKQVKSADDPYKAVANRFKVSRLVAARRALDTQRINRDAFIEYYRTLIHEDSRKTKPAGGPSFWVSQKWRVGRRFGTAVARAAKEDRLQYLEAYRLTELYGDTFDCLTSLVGTRRHRNANSFCSASGFPLARE